MVKKVVKKFKKFLNFFLRFQIHTQKLVNQSWSLKFLEVFHSTINFFLILSLHLYLPTFFWFKHICHKLLSLFNFQILKTCMLIRSTFHSKLMMTDQIRARKTTKNLLKCSLFEQTFYVDVFLGGPLPG